jgi:hypothetical protein
MLIARPRFGSRAHGYRRDTMHQISATLGRPARATYDASALQVAVPPEKQIRSHDTDLLDSWLASMSEDRFERFLSRLAELP